MLPNILKVFLAATLLFVINISGYGQCPDFLLTASETKDACFGVDDGRVSVKLSGGTGSYTTSNFSLWLRIGFAYTPIAATSQVFNGDSIVYTALVPTSEIVPGSNYVVRFTDPGCAGGFVWEIYDNPLARNTEIFANETITGVCAGNDGEILVAPSGGTAPYSLVWTNGPTAIPDDETNPTGLQSGSYDLLITDAMGCTMSTSIVVSAAPDATLSASGSTTICIGTTTTLQVAINNGAGPYTVVIDTTGSGTHRTIAGYNSGDNIVIGPSASNTYSLISVVDNNSCVATVSGSINITVNPLPDATITPAGPFCETDVAVNLSAATAGGTWSGPGITDPVAGTFDPATAGPGSHTINYSVTVAGCTSIGVTTIDVNPAPDATITPAGPFCETDAAVNLAAGTPGGTWSGPGITDPVAGTFDPVTAGVGSHTINYTVTVAGCTSIGVTTIDVNPLPDATITPAGPFCETDVAVNLSAATTGGTWSGPGITDAILGSFDPGVAGPGSHTINYSVTVAGCTSIGVTIIDVNPAPDATITPAGPFCETDAAVNLAAATPGGTWSGPGITDPVAGTFDPATAGPGSHTINYTVTVAGCTSIGVTTIDVNPLPDATITAAGPFCETDAAVNLAAATPGGTWSGPGITDPVAGTFDPVTAGIGSHTINYTVTVAGCTSIGVTTIDVNPLPDATITPAGPFCETDVAVNLSAATAGGTWSGAGITDPVAGTFDPATAGPGSHTINYSVTVAGCTSIGVTTIDVNPAPDATITPAGPFCETDAAMNLAAATPGGTWSGPGITDPVAGTFDPVTAGVGSHTINYTVTVAGCTSIGITTINVNPLPDATITPAGPFCETDVAVNLSAATTGGTWSGPGITDAILGSFDPGVAGPGSHTINYTITVAGCTSIGVTTIDVNPAPDATITPVGPFCETDVAVNLSAATPGGTWSGAGITDPVAGTFDPVTAGPGSHAINYTVTVAGCTSIGVTTIDVNPLPDATITAAGPFCETDAAMNLSAATPGGTWSGPGITNPVAGTFDPVTAGVGSHTINYTVTVAGCTSIGVTTIDVNPLPDATITPVGPFCETDVAVNLTAATSGGTWLGPGITDPVAGTFDPATAGPGSHTINYSVTVAGCTSIGVTTIDVNPKPTPTISGTSNPACQATGEVYSVPSLAGSTYTWSVPLGATIVEPLPHGPSITVNFGLNSGDITVVETSGSGCVSDVSTFSISLQSCPFTADFVTDVTDVCIGGSVLITDASSAPIGTNYSWDFGVDATPASETTQGPHSVSYSSTGTKSIMLTITNGALTDAVTKTINVTDLPTADLSGTTTTCPGSPATLTVSLTGTAPWAFVYNDGTTDVTEIITASPHTFDVYPTITTTYTPVSVTDALCSGIVSGSAVVDVTPPKEVTIRLDSITGTPGASVSVPLRVIDYEDLLTMQFTVQWDPNLLTYANVSNINLTNASLGNFETVEASNGFLMFSWNSGGLTDTTIVDSTAIFSINFTVANTLCSDAYVTIDETPAALTPIELADENLCIANVTVKGGNVENQAIAQITSNDADNIICAGDQVLFTGLPGGMTNYQFYLNGGEVQAGGNNVYLNGALADLDSVNVIVTDALGCSLPAQGIITTVNQITITPMITAISGCGLSDGEVTLAIGGGSSTYTFNWSGPSITDPSLQDQVNLGRGLYSVEVTDAVSGCVEVLDITMSEPVNFTLVTTKTDVTSTGGNDGSIDLTITGGTGPFAVLWSGPNGYTSTDEDITNLFAGTYTATVTDTGEGCTDLISVEITQPLNAIVLNATKTDVTTCGAMDGTINLLITGGSGSYAISWIGPNSFTSNSQNLSGLEGGLYIATVVDLVTTLTAQWSVQVDEPEGFVIDAAVTELTYCDAADGTITLTVTGGSGDFNYAWKDLVGLGFTSTAKDLTDLELGIYRVSVTDNVSGCIDSLDTTVGRPAICDQPCALNVESTTNNTSCPDTEDGVAVINIISGGSGPGNYYVSLDTGKTFMPFEGQDITAIIDQGQGSYLYIVKDTVTACMDTTVANVGVSTNLMANISVTNPGCAENDGIITFNVSGGIIPFEVDIVDSLGNVTSMAGNGFFQFMDLTAGSYFYAVREQSGCTIVASDSIELSVDCIGGCTTLIASAHSFEDATCGSDPNGKAIIDVTGGSSPYEYSTDGVNWIPFISGNEVDKLPPNGTYNIVVRQDEANPDCRAEVSVTINGPELIVLETPIITTQKATCNQNDGAVKVGRVVGGIQPYTYQIDGSFFTLASDSIISDLGAGIHTFSVVDAVGCQADFVFEVESPGVIIATAVDVPVSCTSIFLKAGIRIEVDLDSTTLPGPYEAYVATTSDPDNGVLYQIPDNGIRTILNLDKDFYTVSITSSEDGGCSFSETIPVFSGASPVDFEIIDSDSIVSCIGDIGSITIGNVVGDQDTTFIVQLISESNVILETYELYLFEFEGGFTIDENNSTSLVAGKYYIKIIQNQNECANVEAISELITIYEPLGQLEFVVIEDEVSLQDRPTGSIIGEVKPSGGEPYEALIQLIEPVFEMNITDIIEFNENRDWEEVTSTGGNLNQFLIQFDTLWAGRYEIAVRDGYGCEFVLEHSIGYDETIFIPNVFTPNNDGTNDSFYIRNLPESGTQVVITNRNGSVVYESNDYNYDTLWDGGDVADGVYYYNVSMPSGESYKGWVEKWSGTRP